MESSVIVTTPDSGTRVKSRLRNAANFLMRNSKSRPVNNNKNHTINHKNNRNCSRAHSLRNVAKNVNNCNNTVNVNNPTSCVNNNGNTSSDNANEICMGKFTREVYNAICGRLGFTLHIPGDSVQALFNDMHLYPSKTQVSEMLQCARQCRRNGTSTFLTFGEFCLFASELKNPQSHRKFSHQKKCEVFLGGSCNPTTWRTDTAIPELQKYGISYYNPQVSIWSQELVDKEHDAKQSASVLLYVLDSQTRSVGGMIEVAYLVATGRCVVLVSYPYTLGQTIMGETITNREYIELANGQTSLLSLVRSHGINVHDNLTSALQCTANILRNCSSTNGLAPEEQITNKLWKLRRAFDKYDTNGAGELEIGDVWNAFTTVTNRRLDFYTMYKHFSTSNPASNGSSKINFEQFCAMCAEFSVDGCETFNADVWARQPLQRQCSRNNNSHCDEINKHTNCINFENTDNYTNGDSYLVDIYLGGSCNSTSTWREQVIPLIKRQGLTYYNPAVRETHRYDINYHFNGISFEKRLFEELHWKREIDKSKVLLFVITNDTRSLTTMILASYYIGLNRNVILSIEHLPPEDSIVGNEKLSKQAIKDYNRGRVYLIDLAKRKQIPVFENITEAVQCAMEMCRNR